MQRAIARTFEEELPTALHNSPQPLPSLENQAREGWFRDVLVIFTIGVIARTIWLIVFPVPYGEDAFGRLFFKDDIFLSHWLPLTQVLIYVIFELGGGVVAARFLFAVLGSLAACGFYLFLRLLVGRALAVAGGVIFSLNSLYVLLSLMPYQDVLFLGLLYAGLAFLVGSLNGARKQIGSRSFWGSVLFGLACLTRYEGWFVIPVLLFPRLAEAIRRDSFGRRALSSARETVLVCWGPAVWFLLSFIHWGGWTGFLFQTADGKFFAWHPHFDLSWMIGYAGTMLYWTLLFGSPLVFFAIPGIFRLLQRRQPIPEALKVLLLLGAAVLVFFFIIIGKQQETVFRFSAIPLSIMLVLAVIGLEWTGEWAEGRIADGKKLFRLFLTLVFAGLATLSTFSLSRLNRDPNFRDPYLIAEHLSRTMLEGEGALVVADRSRDLRDAAPLNYQRIATQFEGDRKSILTAGLLETSDPGELLRLAREENVRFLVIFNNFEPWRPADRFYRGVADSGAAWLKPVLTGSISTVYEASHWPLELDQTR